MTHSLITPFISNAIRYAFAQTCTTGFSRLISLADLEPFRDLACRPALVDVAEQVHATADQVGLCFEFFAGEKWDVFNEPFNLGEFDFQIETDRAFVELEKSHVQAGRLRKRFWN